MAGTVLSYREHYQASGDIYWARICVAAAQHVVYLSSCTSTYRPNFLYMSMEKCRLWLVHVTPSWANYKWLQSGMYASHCLWQGSIL